MKQQAVEVEAAAPFTADAWRRQATTGLFHQLALAGHIPAGGGDGAPQVLDQGAGDQIGAHGGGLQVLHELSVAVVHKAKAVGLKSLDPFTQLTDGPHSEGGAPAVAATPLDQHHAGGD